MLKQSEKGCKNSMSDKKSVFRFSNTALWSFIAMIIGAILGMVAPNLMADLKFIGDIWLKAITMAVIPLVFCIIILAIANQDDLTALGRISFRIVVYYMLTTVISIILGIALAWFIKPGQGMSIEGFTVTKVTGDIGDFTIANFVTNLFTSNLIKTFSDGNILQTLVAGVLFGIAVLIIKEKVHKTRVINMVNSLTEMIYSYLRMIIRVTPIGVLFLIADSFGKYGFQIFTSMAGLIGTFWLSIALMILLVYCPILWFVAGISPLKFVKDTTEVWMMAIATCSSTACIPVNIKNCREKWSVPEYINNFCITIGGQVNSHGSSLMYACVFVFTCQVYNIPLELGTMIKLVIVGTLVASSGGGIPGSGIVKLAIVMSTFGFPPEIVGIIAGFYRFFDMGTTTGNVVGDVAGTVTISKMEEKRAKKLGIPFGDKTVA